jgi:hypothetical protein
MKETRVIQDLLKQLDDIEAQQKAAEVEVARINAMWHKAVQDFIDNDPLCLWRIRLERPQQFVAAQAGVYQTNISKLEHGKLGKISEEALRRVLEYYSQLEVENGLNPKPWVREEDRPFNVKGPRGRESRRRRRMAGFPNVQPPARGADGAVDRPVRQD